MVDPPPLTPPSGEETRALEREAEALSQQMATAEILQIISRASGDLAPVFDAILDKATSLCDAAFGILWLRAGERFRPAALRDVPAPFAEYLAHEPSHPAEPGTGLGRILAGERFVHLVDPTATEAYRTGASILRRAFVDLGGMRALLTVALRKDDAPREDERLLGALSIFRQETRPFSDRQIALVTSFATQAVIAVENARLMDELRVRSNELARSIQEMQALSMVGQAVGSTLDQRTVLSTIIGLSVDLAGADAGAIFRYQETDHLYRLVETVGWDATLVRQVAELRIHESETAMGEAAASRAPLQLADLAARPSYPVRDAFLAARFHAVLIVPLVGAGRIFGAMVLQRRAAGEFPPATVRLMQTLASQSVLAIQNARMFHEIAEKNDALASASEHKSQFLATMSHEIRTPMNGVLGMMEVLELQGLTAAQRPIVATMRESAQALLRIVDDVLDFSKIEAGRLELEATAFSLSGLVEGAVDTLRPQALAKGLAIETELDPRSNDALVGDPTRVRQILFNLLSNAVKFTERGGVRVAAGTTSLGGGRARVTIVVRDTGIGLDAAQQARLFEPFAQADSSTTRRYGGTGLGLSIVRRLARLMEGEVAVESEAGLGSAFTVTLILDAAPADSPLRTLAAPAAGSASSSSGSQARAEARVLVVDDHPVNCEVLLRQLALFGVDADTCADGVEALEAWESAPYAAVLLDLHMPRMDGYELARRLREIEAERGLPRTPLVAVTANAMRGEEERCLAAGMDAYLAKPLTVERLRATLERWLPIAEGNTGRKTVVDQRAAASAIDRNILADWVGDDRATIDALLLRFRGSALESRSAIDAAWRAGDLAALAAAAHRLKGAAQSVGAHALGRAAAALERAASAGDRARCGGLLGPLAVESRRVMAEIPQ
jgi:signal transduction histidine kinase/CheY-like chemotaxis protein/HPt (histidine-containing phosphotransfer) domain-containing protein